MQSKKPKDSVVDKEIEEEIFRTIGNISAMVFVCSFNCHFDDVRQVVINSYFMLKRFGDLEVLCKE